MITVVRNVYSGVLCGLDDRLAVFGFDRLMEAIGKASARLGAACVFIDDDDFSICDDVVDVSLHEKVSAEHLAQVVSSFFAAGVFFSERNFCLDLVFV